MFDFGYWNRIRTTYSTWLETCLMQDTRFYLAWTQLKKFSCHLLWRRFFQEITEIQSVTAGLALHYTRKPSVLQSSSFQIAVNLLNSNRAIFQDQCCNFYWLLQEKPVDKRAMQLHLLGVIVCPAAMMVDDSGTQKFFGRPHILWRSFVREIIPCPLSITFSGTQKNFGGPHILWRSFVREILP